LALSRYNGPGPSRSRAEGSGRAGRLGPRRARGASTPRKSSPCRNDLDRTDLRLVDRGREVDVEVAVGDRDRDVDDVGRPRRHLRVQVEVDDLDRSALEVDAEHALPGPTSSAAGDAVVDLREVQTHDVRTAVHADVVPEGAETRRRAPLREVEDVIGGAGDR